jgi:hypothetical protein
MCAMVASDRAASNFPRQEIAGIVVSENMGCRSATCGTVILNLELKNVAQFSRTRVPLGQRFTHTECNNSRQVLTSIVITIN